MDRLASAKIPASTANPSLYSFAVPSVAYGKSATWFYTTIAIVIALLVLEQSVYRFKKRHLPSDKWTIPLIGKFADSMSPSMESYKKQWNSGALSAVSVFNIFIVMASSNEYARKILNSPSFAEPALVHAGKQILSPENWVFLTGKDHVQYRRGLNALFTRKALGIYVAIQESITRKHLKNWLAEAAKTGAAQPIMMTARAMNMDTSLRVFCGNHIPEHAAREINEKYWAITQALELVNFPLALPGTKVYKAIQARKVAMRWLELAAHNSKIAMANGAEPECMLDEWVQVLADPTYNYRKEFSDLEMAMVVFSFLFASQDAMSSGLIYGFQHLADHPEVMAKVKEEQERVRQGDYERALSLETLAQMPYLQAVVKESMRVQPPVLMVPYKATKAFPITDDYTVPANSMVIPSFYNSLHDSSVYPDPESFNPERWLDPQGLANSNPKNYLVFGSGPHRCIGLEYATMNMTLVLATACAMMDWEHEVTPLSNTVEIIATCFPKDGCKLKLTPRIHS
ncbi:cytochrome P450 sterol C22-desaturase [Laccaria bicolor S238N-H82]|uniref:Cytochrome P450 sterol C22-desaturase n=1 Tax=Laccaria bicolor (strain S238N-H82 / ATCC MYA-4686) TaxID=486041 RepID=B0CQX8_LACBS|nr:cytochrome P450 sterol C22-desaturase [Laccaria bicolor S238N-H82]EDR15112.1 cytochrome P450 sterol C22-desaturase [Laccaria bicolor S238N-H82]|eukprot:XP_001873320.1 cytochrome P450 sterol C22-desaturase [Laccaria bicolor S238N-H82]